jgi:hypothetical protein
VRAVDLKLIRAEFYKQYPAEGDDNQKTEARRKAFNRTVKDAQAKSLIMVREIDGAQLVWLVAKTEGAAACPASCSMMQVMISLWHARIARVAICTMRPSASTSAMARTATLQR